MAESSVDTSALSISSPSSIPVVATCVEFPSNCTTLLLRGMKVLVLSAREIPLRSSRRPSFKLQYPVRAQRPLLVPSLRFQSYTNWSLSKRRRTSDWASFAENPTQSTVSEDDCDDPFTEAAPASPLDVRPSEQNNTRQFVAMVTTLMIVGIVLSVLTVFFVTSMGMKLSIIKVLRKFIKSDIARQVLTISALMVFVRSGLTPMTKGIREFIGTRTPWESSLECYFLKELYSPLELLLVVAALAALSESLLPTLISVPRNVIDVVVRSTLSLTFVLAAARVVYNMKTRIFRESKWRMELEGKKTDQRRIDAIDKLITVAIFIVAIIMGLQTLGLDINSVLAIGGVGGLAIGLAGREIFENLFSGLLIMGSRAFEVGDEVVLATQEIKIEGNVLDVGWYRTIVKDFQREVYVIPNSLFTRTVILNVTRKGREWRFFENIKIRVDDLDKVEEITAYMRQAIRNDKRVVQKLHKRAFLDEITMEYISIYISFYVEAPNRDAFLGIRQEFFFRFVDCIERYGAEIAEKRFVVEVDHNGNTRMPYLDDALGTIGMVEAKDETIIESDSGQYSEETSKMEVSSVVNNEDNDNVRIESKNGRQSGNALEMDVSSVIKKTNANDEMKNKKRNDTRSSNKRKEHPHARPEGRA